MTFRRTASGLASLHVFFRVDKVAFCEGGPPIDLANALLGNGEETTFDIMFWRGVAGFWARGSAITSSLWVAKQRCAPSPTI